MVNSFTAVLPAHIQPTLDDLESAAFAALSQELERILKALIQESELHVNRQDVKAIADLNHGLALALQRPILTIWEEGWKAGSAHAIQEMQAAVPDRLKAQSEQFNLGDDIRGAIAALFRFTAKTFRNAPAERAVQQRVLKLAGSFSKDTLDGVKADLLAAVTPQKDTGNPISRDELGKRLQGRLGVSSVRAKIISRTEVTNAYNQGRLNSYADSPLVEYLRFLAIHDHRVTEICASRDGMLIPMAEGRAIAANTPPLHYQCRSILSPVMPRVQPAHQKMVQDPTRLYSNRNLAPLMKGWHG